MEEDYSAFANDANVDVFKFRGDEVRDFVSQNFNKQSFPTVNLVQPDGTIVKYESEDRTPDALKASVEKALA